MDGCAMVRRLTWSQFANGRKSLRDLADVSLRVFRACTNVNFPDRRVFERGLISRGARSGDVRKGEKLGDGFRAT